METHKLGSFEEAKLLVESWRKQGKIQAYCLCSGPNRDFLPQAEIEKTRDGYIVRLFYVCAFCGRKR